MQSVVSEKSSPARRKWLTAAGFLTIAFCWPLFKFIGFTLHSGLYSYALLIPFVSLFLVWRRKKDMPTDGRPARLVAWIPLSAAVILLAWFSAARLSGQTWDLQDMLSLTVSAWVLLLIATSLWFLDPGTVRAQAFPLAFLVFMVPLPLAAEKYLEFFLQHGSALAARLYFNISGTPYFYNDLTFRLPGFNMQVAPECSGIHSTLVLLVTSALAAHLFLRSPWNKAILVLIVVPLALLRNGLRAFVIGELCVRIGPEMIHSWIHHRGGPLFFALSLIPLFLLLYGLHRSERRSKEKSTT